MRISVVVPTFNEADNVRPLSERLLALGIEGLHILFVDDDSPDGTGRILDCLAAGHPGRIGVLHRSTERGLGRAYVDGFRHVLAEGADLVVQMDCDFSHSPADVPRLVDGARDYDVVVGSRYVAGGRTDDRWGWGRRVLSWWANSV